METVSRTAQEVYDFLDRRLKLYELAARNARNNELKDRCDSVALHCRAAMEYLCGGTEALTDKLDPEHWAAQVKRQF